MDPLQPNPVSPFPTGSEPHSTTHLAALPHLANANVATTVYPERIPEEGAGIRVEGGIASLHAAVEPVRHRQEKSGAAGKEKNDARAATDAAK